MLSKSLSHREPHLDGLRGLAAFNVVIFHTLLCFDRAFASGANIEAHFGWETFIAGAPFVLMTHGTLPVMIFFVLSGYVLAKFLERNSLSFGLLIARRFIRFAIPIFITTMIAYLLISLFPQPELYGITRSTWLTKVYQQIPSFFGALTEGLYGALFGLVPQEYSYNPSLWTMSIEFAGSCLLIFVFQMTSFFKIRAGARRKWHILIFLSLGVLGFYSYLSLFAFGAVLASLSRLKPINSGVAAVLLFSGLLLGTVPWSAVPWWGVDFAKTAINVPKFLPLPMSSIIEIYSAIGSILIFYAVLCFKSLRSLLNSPIVQFLGRISFPLYLIHLPIMITLVAKLAISLHLANVPYGIILPVVIVVQICAAILAAWLLYPVCEKPAIDLSRNLTRGRLSPVLNLSK